MTRVICDKCNTPIPEEDRLQLKLHQPQVHGPVFDICRRCWAVIISDFHHKKGDGYPTS